ncbi:MAG: hypothetical protein AB7N24_12475 [Dehalococcoidia bacterium]
MTESSGPPEGGDFFSSSVRLRRARTFWVPLALVALDGLLLLLSLILAIVVLPIIFIGLMLFAFLRFLFGLVTGRRRKKKGAASPEDLPGSDTTLRDEERQELAEKYRPCLVLFPEDGELGPPYRTDEMAHLIGADYHPRPVSLIFNHVRLRRGRAQWLPDLPGTTSAEDIRKYIGDAQEHRSSLEIPWLHGGNPIKIVRHLFPFGRQFQAHWAIPVPKADCGCSVAVWERYVRIIEHDAARPPEERRYDRMIYARVLEGRELPEIGEGHPLSGAIAIQYWWYFFYNDAWNRHQSDWEGVTVYLLQAGDGSYRPLGAAYGTHDLGRWRRWEDLQKTGDDARESSDGLHPVVYVARGSHASYFEYNQNGYHPSMTRRLRVPFIGDYQVPSQFVIETRNAIDWVADADSGAGNGERLLVDKVAVMPHNKIIQDLPTLRDDEEWWWLAYRGLWGSPEVLPFFGGSGPRGPREQGIRWDNPFQWVMRECIADDLPYWIQMFAAWQEPESPMYEPQ